MENWSKWLGYQPYLSIKDHKLQGERYLCIMMLRVENDKE